MSKYIRSTSCPECGSEDNLAIYDDHEYCFGASCGHYKSYGSNSNSNSNSNKERGDIITESGNNIPLTPLPLGEMPGIKRRGLSSTTVNKYRVTVGTNPEGKIEAIYPRFSGDKHVGNQVRYKDKKFSYEGSTKAELFGLQLFPEGGRSITVTEGYYDAMAAFELTGSRYPNVGVMSASTAKKEVVDNFEKLNSFQTIILNFDSDEPGQQAAKECAQLFAPGKVKILKLRKGKDANEYLMKGFSKEYVDEWFKAAPFMPDGLQLGNDPALLEEIIKYKEPRSIPYPWKGLNLKTFGIRTSELVLMTAETGIGKTSVMKEIEYTLLTHPELVEEGAGVGFLHLEEPKRDLAVGLMSIHKNKPYHFPDVERTEAELSEAYNEVLNTDRVVIWDHFGSNDIDTVLAKIRHMSALGCRYIMVDHLSIIVSDQSGDERKQLDEISTKIKTLTMNLDISVFCVIHVNRSGQIRGSAGPEQVANIIIRLERDKKEADEWRRNVMKLSVEKNRKYGRTGPASYLHYNEMTGRLDELDEEDARKFETGGSRDQAGGAGNEFAAYDER